MTRLVPAVLLVLMLLASGCSQSLYTQGKIASEQGDYDSAVTRLYEAIAENPEDYRAWRELGVVYYRRDSLEKAEEAFAASNKIKPNALSNLYLGLIFERTGQLDRAIRVYGAAINLRGDGNTVKMIRDRLDVLIDNKLMQDARNAVDKEESITSESLPENSIAVINFNGTALSEDLQPLALGLAEFTAIDLAKVSQLRVLERVKINVILDELALSQSKYADPATAPRVGRLLGSRQIVLGTVIGTGENSFRIDGKLVDTIDGDVSGTRPNEGRLDRFFDVQKEFVFTLIDTLGIELSREERDAIEEIPTESMLAFMAYSKGLFFQQRGMHEDAARSFRSAERHDPDFQPASSMASKMENTASYNRGMNGETGGETTEFENEITASMQTEDMTAGLDQIQAANLINSNFILNSELYWNFGSTAVAPPGGGSIWTGFGVIVIKGDFDAN